ncbi:MAG: hypothetical protein ACRDTG_06025 [Pseudonocardiaceae bacterium]
MTNELPWRIEQVDICLDRWHHIDNPDPDLQVLVADWLMTRMADPYEGATPDADQPDLWFAAVPDSGDGYGNVVTCSYRVNKVNHTVTCDIIVKLAWPV